MIVQSMSFYNEWVTKGILKRHKGSFFVKGTARRLYSYSRDKKKKMFIGNVLISVEMLSLSVPLRNFIVSNIGKKVKLRTIRYCGGNKIKVIATLELIKKSKKNKKRR